LQVFDDAGVIKSGGATTNIEMFDDHVEISDPG